MQWCVCITVPRLNVVVIDFLSLLIISSSLIIATCKKYICEQKNEADAIDRLKLIIFERKLPAILFYHFVFYS